MLTITSKRVKEVVEKMCLSVVVCFKGNSCLDTDIDIVLRQLTVMTDRWHIITLALPRLDLNHNLIGLVGAQSVAVVLGQCPTLAHLDLICNNIGAEGEERLVGVLGQCAALAHLDLCINRTGDAGTEKLVGVLSY